MLNLYVFQAGRRAFVTREVARRAAELGATQIGERAARAADHDARLLSKQQRRQQAGGSVYGPEAVGMDNQVDHGTVGFYGYLDAMARMYRDSELGDAAELVRDRLFPEGPGAVIRLPYPRQHSALAGLLSVLEEPDTAALAALIPGLADLATRLRELNEEYGAVLHDYDDVPSADEIRADDRQGQENLAEIVILILAHGLSGADDAAAQRDHLLEPIQRQNEAIRQARRRRRAVNDVDPDTGDELPDPDIGDELPGDELPGDELPGDELPGDELPGSPAGGDPGEELPGGEPGAPGENAPGDQAPASATRRAIV